MQLYLTSTFALVAVLAIGMGEASPSPIRYVTPKPGIDYRIRTVRPNPRYRYLRSIDEDQFVADSPRFQEPAGPLEPCSLYEKSGDQLVDSLAIASTKAASDVVDEVRHVVSKRSPRRVVINYTPPPPNGPRYARSADAKKLIEEFEE